MGKPKLAIVIGSIRPNRFGGHAAQWIEEIARRGTDFEVELIDLKDYPMPLFAEEASPLYAPSKDEVARRWQKKVGEFDAFIFTAAEYNRGPTAALKNALDYAYTEWGNKAGRFRRLRRRWRRSRGRATAAPRHRVADGADPQPHSLMVDRQQATNWRVCHALRLEDSQYQQRCRDGFAGDI